MQSSEREKWIARIDEARRHPKGVRGYLAEHKIAHACYYKWFKELKDAREEWQYPLGTRHREASRRRDILIPVTVKREVRLGEEERIEIRLLKGHTIFLPADIGTERLRMILESLVLQGC